MSFEKDFNSTSILGGMAFTASMAGGLLGEIAQAVKNSRNDRDRPGVESRPAGGSALGLRMVERHVDYHARCGLRALDDAKRNLDRDAPRLSLGKNTKDVYMGLYNSLYVFAFREIHCLREWNHEQYARIAYSSGHRCLGAADLHHLRLQWVCPLQGNIKAIITAMNRRRCAVDGELKSLGRTHGEVVFAWLILTGALHASAVEKLQTVHDSIDAVMVSELVDRRTARELGE